MQYSRNNTKYFNKRIYKIDSLLSMISVYKGYSTAGSQTSLRLDRRMARYDFGRCTAIWTKDASWNKRKGQAEKWAWGETDDWYYWYTVLIYANHAKVTYTTIVVFLVVATIRATIDSEFCDSFLSLRLICERNEWHPLLFMPIFYPSQRMH